MKNNNQHDMKHSATGTKKTDETRKISRQIITGYTGDSIALGGEPEEKKKETRNMGGRSANK